jgi:hypothetical protein
MTPRSKVPHIETKPCAGVFDIENAAFDLLCIIMSDRPVQQLLSKYRFDGIQSYYDERKEERVLKLIIEIATLYRLNFWSSDAEIRQKAKLQVVGSLFTEKNEEPIDLYMQEACNKILHAKSITFEVRKVPKTQLYYYNQRAILEGEKSGEQWSAFIQLIEFCEAAFNAPDPDLPF